MHDFWVHEDPAQRQTEMISFLKNLALAGGALALMGAEEPWEASVATGHTLSKKVRKIGRASAAWNLGFGVARHRDLEGSRPSAKAVRKPARDP